MTSLFGAFSILDLPVQLLVGCNLVIVINEKIEKLKWIHVNMSIAGHDLRRRQLAAQVQVHC